MKCFFSVVANKRGSEMVEASIAMPIIVLAIVLLIRLFTFYLNILTAGINAHEAAIDIAKNYSGLIAGEYDAEEKVEMIKGGLLSRNLSKKINVECFLVNEDCLVRSSDVVKK